MEQITAMMLVAALPAYRHGERNNVQPNHLFLSSKKYQEIQVHVEAPPIY